MYLLIFYIVLFVFIGYFLWKSPMLDENGNVLIEEKKLKDLFKKKKNDRSHH